MRTIAFTILLLICSAHSYAQEVAELYQTEIIVFKQIDADIVADRLKDVSHPKTALHKERAALNLLEADADSDIRALPQQQLQLTAEAQKIKQDSRYELLYHGGWQQPPYHRAQAPYINILNELQNGLLKGTAWLSYERYFKLLLDFRYDPEFSQTAEVVDTPQAFSIPIHLERTMSDEKLFYIDHTIIGVIALISPITKN